MYYSVEYAAPVEERDAVMIFQSATNSQHTSILQNRFLYNNLFHLLTWVAMQNITLVAQNMQRCVLVSAETEHVVVWTDQSLSHLRVCVCESPCCRHTCTHKEAVLPSHSHQGTCCPVAELPLQSNKSRSRRVLTRTLMMQRSTAAASYSQTLSLTDMSLWQTR